MKDGKKDFANVLIGDEATGTMKHLSNDNIEDVKVSLLGKTSFSYF